jgi:hypothetical protein
VSGSPITSSGNITINLPTASATNRGVLSSTDWATFNNKVSSVGLSMPSAFSVANSPITGSGTIAVTGAGTVAQYIRGDGSLADFPSGGGGGGASVNYYLNGSVSQGSIGGIGYSQMSKTPILGAGTDFTISSTNYIASFITDAGNPALLEIPAGNWNFESYFSASSGGGSPSFYIELYKVNSGGTATLIASSSATPELISFGTSISPYFSPLAVPATVLTITDRLAVRYFVNNSGRTITLHTENSHLCQIITTFTTGLTALNGLTAQVQNFATGTSGTDFAISSSVSTHTFNLPTASATNRGALSSSDWTTFNNKTSNVGTVTSVGLSSATSGVTIGSTPITTSGTITLAIATASGSQNGLLSSTDWTTFNNKQNALTNPVTGTGVAGQVALWNGTNSINSDAEFTYNSSTNLLTIGGGVTLTGAQTIQTSTGNLTLATAAGDGNIVLSAHGDGNVTTNDSIYIGSNSGINYGGFSNKLSVASTGYNFFDVSRFSNDNDGPRLYLGKSRGSTVGSNVIVQNGDLLGTISFEGDCGEGMVPAASISAEVDGVPGLTTDMPGRLIFRTCSDNTIFAAERLRIDSTGTSTFSGALNGTSASFTSTITSNNAIGVEKNGSGTFGSGGRFYLYNAATTDGLLIQLNASNNIDYWGVTSNTPTASPVITFTRAGAATFSSSVTAQSFGISNGYYLVGRNAANTAFRTLVTFDSSNKILIGQDSDITAITLGVGSEAMRITSGGDLLVGKNASNWTANGLQTEINGRTFGITNSTGGDNNLFLRKNGATGNVAAFYYDSTGVGSISITAVLTAYNTTSDYRLKEDLQEIKGLEKVQAIKVYDYKWKSEESRMDGVLAHELAEVLPYAVTGEKDEVNEDGTDKMQGVDYSKIVPILIKAIQEQQEQINQLKNQIK